MWGNHLAKSVEKILKKDAANNAIYSDSSILSMKTYKDGRAKRKKQEFHTTTAPYYIAMPGLREVKEARSVK